MFDQKVYSCDHQRVDEGTLKIIMNLRRVSPAELARRAGLSRQAISKWNPNPRWQTIQKVAQALNVAPEQLTRSLLSGVSSEEQKRVIALTLWDHLYPGLPDFIAALVRQERKAVARYIQAFGILNAEKVFGKWVYQKFDSYSGFLPPALRKDLRQLCLTLHEMHLI